MKSLFLLFTLVSALFGAEVVEVEERFSTSIRCKGCHIHIVKEWESSWHAASHYKNNEYFRKSIDYVSRKTRKSLNSVKVQCATCHNPRISVTSTGIDYEIDFVMGLDKGSDVNKALESNTLNEGINCIVCHNIDKIHTDKDQNVRGINRVEWTASGVMSGPYNDSSSPYHKVEYRDFMDEKSNQLCFVCHANDKSVSGLVFSNMQSEYKKGAKSCVECHMGAKKKGVAATLRNKDGKRKQREIRAHRFEGAHTSHMWKDALSLKLSIKKSNLLIELKNPQPHNIPSGFGSREILIEVVYKDKGKVLYTKNVSLTRKYISKRNKATIPHLAVKESVDMSVPAQGKKIVELALFKGATSIEVSVYYRLVNDEVQSILKLKEAIWSEKNLITSGSLKLN